MALTLRLTKGSPLTHTELDDNFSHLQGLINSLNTETGSLLYSGSFDESSSTLILYSDNQRYEVDLSALVDVTDTGSFYISSSVNLNTITFTQGDGTTQSVTVNTGSDTDTNIYSTDGTLAGARSVAAGGNDLTFEFPDGYFTINSDPSQRVVISNLPTQDQPQVVGIDSSGTLKAMNTSSIAGISTDISALNTFTGSIQTEVDSLTAATSSYLTGANTGSFYISSSVSNNTITFNQGDGTTESVTVDTGSDTNLGTADQGLTGARTVTANGSSLTFEFDSAPFIINSDVGQRVTIANLPTQDQPQVVGIDSSGNLKAMNTSSIAGGGASTDITALNTFTGSIQIEVDNLTSATSSYVTNDNTGSFYYSSSVELNTVTFYQGDGTTESVTVDTGSVIIDGAGRTRYITRWVDSNTITSASIYEAANKNIGIGPYDWNIVQPLYSLHVKSDTDTQILVESDADINIAGIKFKTEDTDDDRRIKGAIFFDNEITKATDGYGRGDLLFATNTAQNDDNATPEDWNLKIDTSAKSVSVSRSLAIGTDSFADFDDARLVVKGGISGSGDVYFPGLVNTILPRIVGYDIATGQLSYYETGSFGVGGSTDISALNLHSGSINTFTGSIQIEVDSLTNATSSYLTGEDTGSFLYSGSYDSSTSNIRLYSADQNYDLDLSGLVGGSGGLAITASYTGSELTKNVRSFDFEGNGVKATNVGNAVTVTVTQVDTGSLYYSSSVELNTVTFYQGDGTTESVTVDTGSVGTLQTVTDNGNKTTNGIDIAKLFISGSDTTSLVVDVKNSDLSSSFQIYNNGAVAAYGKGGTTSNVALGLGALGTVGTNNTTLIGGFAGGNNTGTLSTIIGGYAGNSNTANSATILGYQAGWYNTGAESVLVGSYAGKENSGGSVTFIGTNAGQLNTGNSNTGVGYLALNSGSGRDNTALGTLAGYETGDLTGNNNTFLGYNASYGVNTSITNATAVGANVTLAESNTVVLGDNANVGIGTNAVPSKLTVRGDISGSADVYFSGLSNTSQPNIVGYDTATGQLSYYSTASFGSGGGSTDTGSFYISSSVNLNTITFTQGDGTTERVTVDTGSNIYTADGSLLTDRTVSAGPGVNGKSLTFEFQNANFIINSDPGREVQINNLDTADTPRVVGYADGILKAMPTSSFKPGGPLNTFQFNKNNAFSGSSLFFDSANERVGIGESSPDFPLHITDTRPIGIKLERTDDPIVGIQFYGNGATGGGAAIRGLANDFEIIQRDSATSQNERNLFISQSGEVYIPRIDQSTTVNLLGYDTATGEVTYQRNTSNGGGRLNNFAVPTGSLHYGTNTVATTVTSSFVTIAGTVNTGDGLNSHTSREYSALKGKTLGTDAFVTATWKDYAEGSISSQYIVVQSITAGGALTIRTADVTLGANDAIMFTAMILI